jgi:Flp pilus assembly protein TadB
MIDRATRIPLFIVFSIVSAIGLVLFGFIVWRSYIEKSRQMMNRTAATKTSTLDDISRTLKIAIGLLKTRNMLLLLIPFAYSGR